MAGFVRLIQCVARAAVKNGGKAFCNLVPFGEVAFQIARDAYNDYRDGQGDSELRADLQGLAQASPAEFREVVQQAVTDQAAGQSEPIRQALTAYLQQMPVSVRQSLRRASDPTGKTVPAALPLQTPEDLLSLLPGGLPRFKPGDRPLAADWELVELLGMGGFGEVWKARHLTRSSVKPVALKFCLDPQAARTLRNEAALHDLLDRLRTQNAHLGVVPLLETFLRADPPCLMYELIEGGDLAGLARDLQEQGSLTAELATRMVQRLASIVGSAHRLDPPLVHRDLKLSNVLVRRGEGGKVSLLVADFGIGGLAAGQALREQANRPVTSQTLSAAVRGSYTPLYASPQQAAGGPPDPRDDVHALGVIWYQLLVGDLGLTAIPPDWRDVAEERGLSPEQVGVLAACLASRAEKRPADAAELADRLSRSGSPRALGTQSVPAEPPAVQPEPGRTGRWSVPAGRVNSLGRRMAVVPEFHLPQGIQPQDRVTYAWKECVSNEDYRQFVLSGGCPPRVHPKYPHLRTWSDDNTFPDTLRGHPVIYVTQADAVAFCEWLTRKERAEGVIGPADEYRLPTLAEWQGLARRCPLTAETVVGREWLPGRCQPTEPVNHGTFAGPGLYCLLGNVFEWCADSDEREVEVPGPGGIGKQRKKIQRFAAVGGGWASTRDWLQAEVERGSFGAIMCPHGWPMRDGGFRPCLVVRMGDVLPSRGQERQEPASGSAALDLIA